MGLSEQIKDYLKSITLAHLLEKHNIQEVSKRQDHDYSQIIELPKSIRANL
jgi:Rrf2 family iron-sulfur cluster assembly transcriptional regulator